MSLNKSVIFIIISLATCTLFGLAFFNKSNSISSVQDKKTNFSISGYSMAGFAERTFDLKIVTPDLEKVSDEDIINIQAIITFPFDYSEELHYKWSLGQNVELKSGIVSDNIKEIFKKDIPYKIEIQVKGFTKNSNRHIRFEIGGQRFGRPIFAEGLISSQPEKSFEYTVKKMERLKAEKTGVKK